MKKKMIVLGILVLIILVLGLLRLFSPEDTWLCVNSQWVKHGNPSSAMPLSNCGDKQYVGNDKITVSYPASNELVNSPLEVTGQARGSWFFEASFPIQLVDSAGQTVTVAIAQAQGDWMTEQFVPFVAKLEFLDPKLNSGKLILKKDNPSGLAKFDDSIEIPVRFR